MPAILRALLFGLSLASVATLGAWSALPIWALEFPPTTDRGAPSRTVGAGQRGNDTCSVSTDQLPLMALVPPNNVSTLAGDQAVLFLNLPAGQQSAELFIKNHVTNQVVSNQAISLSGEAGIAQISLEADLEPDTPYFWEFAIICDPQDRTKDNHVSGWVTRLSVEPGMEQPLAETNDPLIQAERYADAMLWQETLMLAASLRSQSPEPWTTLLTSVGLESLATVPFVALAE